MAQVNGTDKVSALSESQWKTVKDVLNKKGFSDAKVTENAVGEAGDNYVANVVRVVAEKKSETFKMVAKIAPRTGQLRETMNARLLFINEVLMYTAVLPKFTELEIAIGIPEEERFRYAACYGTLTEEFEEMILLEDLKESDHTMLDRFKSLTDDEMKLILKSFAKMHSLSYALRHQEPETFANFKNKLLKYSDMNGVPAEQMKKSFEAAEADAISKLQNMKHKIAMKDTISKITELDDKNSSWEFNSKYSVITHGDAWTNNVLFHLEDGKAVSCCMIDYQISRINSPATDLLHTILNCTDHKTRKQHFIDWIDYYHSELAKHLFEFGLKAEFVCPKDQLDADLKRHTKALLGRAGLGAFMLSRESAEAEKLKANMDKDFQKGEEKTDGLFGSVASMSEKSQNDFKSRIEGLIDTCFEFGLI
ncbi:ecdysteroid kinase domain-containing protein [Phthorimaea operculella]|nr:ecdysteroid kinase domain-containing protein [Phthorimaea operculella]